MPAVSVLDPEELLKAFGAIGLFLIIFAESGLLIGFFLPGDSLLFTAGLLSSQDKLPALPVLLLGCTIAAIAGDQVGYIFGRRVGPSLFRRPDSRFFHQRHVERAKTYFDAHGPKTIVLARFIPIVRTFAPILAGVGHMEYRTFVSYNVIGAVAWVFGVTTLGYVLGETVPNIDKYLLPAIGVIILLSVIPVLLEMRRQRSRAAVSPDPGDPDS